MSGSSQSETNAAKEIITDHLSLVRETLLLRCATSRLSPSAVVLCGARNAVNSRSAVNGEQIPPAKLIDSYSVRILQWLFSSLIEEELSDQSRRSIIPTPPSAVLEPSPHKRCIYRPPLLVASGPGRPYTSTVIGRRLTNASYAPEKRVMRLSQVPESSHRVASSPAGLDNVVWVYGGLVTAAAKITWD
ncbi:hypothetical protein BDW22DRAFT_1419323 [Trametopsis cervina]|nr:hypothetical protein BDW22DRAFT_1419323 [Trametopsis cervina]